jgi:hypothetical protein
LIVAVVTVVFVFFSTSVQNEQKRNIRRLRSRHKFAILNCTYNILTNVILFVLYVLIFSTP